jgi:hypothetical protein
MKLFIALLLVLQLSKATGKSFLFFCFHVERQFQGARKKIK